MLKFGSSTLVATIIFGIYLCLQSVPANAEANVVAEGAAATPPPEGEPEHIVDAIAVVASPELCSQVETEQSFEGAACKSLGFSVGGSGSISKPAEF